MNTPRPDRYRSRGLLARSVTGALLFSILTTLGLTSPTWASSTPATPASIAAKLSATQAAFRKDGALFVSQTEAALKGKVVSAIVSELRAKLSTLGDDAYSDFDALLAENLELTASFNECNEAAIDEEAALLACDAAFGPKLAQLNQEMDAYDRLSYAISTASTAVSVYTKITTYQSYANDVKLILIDLPAAETTTKDIKEYVVLENEYSATTSTTSPAE